MKNEDTGKQCALLFSKLMVKKIPRTFIRGILRNNRISYFVPSVMMYSTLLLVLESFMMSLVN